MIERAVCTVGGTDDGHRDAVGCIIDQGKGACSQTGQIVYVVVDIALLTASSIAVLAVSLTVNAGDRIRISGNGASLKALVVVK